MTHLDTLPTRLNYSFCHQDEHATIAFGDRPAAIKAARKRLITAFEQANPR